jgi:hypothetical protein
LEKNPPSPPHLVANLCDVPYYAMIKNGYVLHPYPVWPGTGNGTRRTGSHSVRHISGLPVSMAMPMLETLRYFYPNLSQLRRGRFCSFVFVIITNSLLLLLCRSDLIKDAVKKYDEKTKKSALFFFKEKNYYILTPHRLKLHTFGVNFLSREFQYFLPLHEKKITIIYFS